MRDIIAPGGDTIRSTLEAAITIKKLVCSPKEKHGKQFVLHRKRCRLRRDFDGRSREVPGKRGWNKLIAISSQLYSAERTLGFRCMCWFRFLILIDNENLTIENFSAMAKESRLRFGWWNEGGRDGRKNEPYDYGDPTSSSGGSHVLWLVLFGELKRSARLQISWFESRGPRLCSKVEVDKGI